MNMRESFRGAVRRLGEVRVSGTTMWQSAWQGLKPLSYLTAGTAALKRRTTQQKQGGDTGLKASTTLSGAAIGTAEGVAFQSAKHREGRPVASTENLHASGESAR